MPPPARKNLPHKALLWEVATGADRTDADGEVQVRREVEIKVRWETNQTESTSFEAQGATVAFEGVVVVAREIAVGSLMWRGGLSDFYGTGTGGDEDNLGGRLMQVNGYSDVPDAKGRTGERTVKLIRYRDRLPTVID